MAHDGDQPELILPEDEPWLEAGFSPYVPSAARIYDYLLGGFHNFAVDRKTAEVILASNPNTPLVFRANRALMHRVVRHLVSQGVDAIIDVGSGIPTVGNVHEIVEQIGGTVRVLYIDNDPAAVAQSRHLLRYNPSTEAILADARDASALAKHPSVQRLLRFSSRPAVLAIALLHFVLEDDVVQNFVDSFVSLLPVGGYLAIAHGTFEDSKGVHAPSLSETYQTSRVPFRSRTKQQLAHLLSGLSVVAPGIVFAPEWRPLGPDDIFFDDPARSANIIGVGQITK